MYVHDKRICLQAECVWACSEPTQSDNKSEKAKSSWQEKLDNHESPNTAILLDYTGQPFRLTALWHFVSLGSAAEVDIDSAESPMMLDALISPNLFWFIDFQVVLLGLLHH